MGNAISRKALSAQVKLSVASTGGTFSSQTIGKIKVHGGNRINADNYSTPILAIHVMGPSSSKRPNHVSWLNAHEENSNVSADVVSAELGSGPEGGCFGCCSGGCCKPKVAPGDVVEVSREKRDVLKRTQEWGMVEEVLTIALEDVLSVKASASVHKAHDRMDTSVIKSHDRDKHTIETPGCFSCCFAPPPPKISGTSTQERTDATPVDRELAERHVVITLTYHHAEQLPGMPKAPKPSKTTVVRGRKALGSLTHANKLKDMGVRVFRGKKGGKGAAAGGEASAVAGREGLVAAADDAEYDEVELVEEGGEEPLPEVFKRVHTIQFELHQSNEWNGDNFEDVLENAANMCTGIVLLKHLCASTGKHPTPEQLQAAFHETPLVVVGQRAVEPGMGGQDIKDPRFFESMKMIAERERGVTRVGLFALQGGNGVTSKHGSAVAGAGDAATSALVAEVAGHSSKRVKSKAGASKPTPDAGSLLDGGSVN